MDLSISSQVGDVPDIRHRVRQLRWFKTSFRHHARLVCQHYGLAFDIDDARLTEAFLNWAEAFAADKSYADLDRRDFGIFAAGLLLRELMRARAVTARDAQGPASVATGDKSWPIAHAWPEGFLATNYVLCILAAVLEQEGMTLTLGDLADDLRTWWSYRENVGEDASQAVAFLDLLTGNEPNWFMPDSVSGRAAMRRALTAGVVPGQRDRLLSSP